jgi:hypothetical protein
MFCFVIPFNEEDKKIYELVRQETTASVTYNSKWLIFSHIFEANYFLYVAFEANHQGMLSLDVIIVRKGNLERHMASRSRYVIKYEPCVTLEGTAVRRDTTGCRHMGGQFECKHVFWPRNHLMGIMQSIYHYLCREGFTRNPSCNYMYYMRELCEEYDTVVFKYLIEQFISAMTLLHKNTMILHRCECNLAEDCVCKSVTDYFCKK